MPALKFFQYMDYSIGVHLVRKPLWWQCGLQKPREYVFHAEIQRTIVAIA
jgi:hypothetical protein